MSDPEWEARRVATYDNPATQCRECWANGKIVASYKMPLLEAAGHWPPPPRRFFFGANVGPWVEGQIIGNPAAIATREEPK